MFDFAAEPDLALRENEIGSIELESAAGRGRGRRRPLVPGSSAIIFAIYTVESKHPAVKKRTEF